MLATCRSHCCVNYCEKVVIDIEGYKLKSTGFIIKELTICSESALDTVFFKPPCRFDVLPSVDQSNINWLVKSLHGFLGKTDFTHTATDFQYIIAFQFVIPELISSQKVQKSANY